MLEIVCYTLRMASNVEIYQFDQRDDLEPLVRQKLNENFRRLQNRATTYQQKMDQYIIDNAGTRDYNVLDNKPTIEGTTLIGDLELPDINVRTLTDEEIEEILDCHCDPQWDDDAMGYYLDQVAQMLEEANALPAGGTTNQVLTKASNTDFDTIWADVMDDDAPIPNIDIDDIITMSDLGDL